MQLEKFAFGVQTVISDAVLREGIMAGGKVRVTAYRDAVAHCNLMTLRYHLTGERLDQIECPADWWQALKLRWLPRWLLSRWPVTMRRWEARVYYPQISLPEEAHVIRFERQES